jgi:hypothetical protein
MSNLDYKLNRLLEQTNKKRFYNKEYAKVKIPNKSSFKLGEFVGAFSGDGNYCFNKKTGHHRIRIYLHKYDDREYAVFLKNLIKNLFNKDACIYSRENCSIVSMSSRKIYDILKIIIFFGNYKSLDFSLNGQLKDYENFFLRGFVRGLMDTDGYVSTNGNICIGLISKSAINQLSKILEKEKIIFSKSKRAVKGKMKHPLHILSLSRKSTEKYLEIIGFSNPRKRKMAIERNLKCSRRDLNPH